MTSDHCPPKNHLADYVSGVLDKGSSQPIADHVEACPSCEETLCELENSSDTVLDKLRAPEEPNVFADEAEYGRSIRLVQELGKQSSTSAEDVTMAADLSSPGVSDEESETLLGMLGNYQLLTKLGQGGMGAVYKAKHTRLRRVVALKVLPGNLLLNEAAIARFDREMHAVGQLDHPNIIRASDAGEIDGTHYLVMELVQGDDLSVIVARNGPLSVPDACEIIRQAAMGLQHAFENGLVHRDIKPSNLMLNTQGQIKILDMGLALLDEPMVGEAEGLTSTGQMMGTMDYIAPEQVTDSHQVDIRADIYS